MAYELAELKGEFLLKYGSIVATILLVGCVILFYLTSPTADHLPPLSETGIFPLGREYFSFIGTIVGVGIIVIAICLHKKLKKDKKMIRTRYIRNLLLCLAGVCLMGLTVFPAIVFVDEKVSSDNFVKMYLENNISLIIHLGNTLLFFLSMLIVMGITIKISSKIHPKKVFYQRIIAFCCTLFFWPLLPILTFVLGIGGKGNFEKCGFHNLEEHDPDCVSFYFTGSLAQYGTVLSVVFFIYTFIHELKGLRLVLMSK